MLWEVEKVFTESNLVKIQLLLVLILIMMMDLAIRMTWIGQMA